ncbi:MAG: 7-cyano-7-deazaguanine synthase QueC [Thermoplasmata archaeon]
MRRGVVLLSGGLDSATVMGIADSEVENISALTFLYGQRAEKEIECAKKLAEYYRVEKHQILNIPLSDLTASSLLKGGEEIPVEENDEIPSTYVPARNMILLSYGVSHAESVGADAVYIGANAVDFSGYPDCRPEFYRAFQKAVDEGTKRGVGEIPIEIRVPLQNMSKKQIIQRGYELGVPYDLTWSCYRGDEQACGACDSCRLRLKGFKEAGLGDPIEYEQR